MITGSVRGIGFLLTTGLSKCGTQVIINNITVERAELTVERLHQEGIQTVVAPFNVTHKRGIGAAIEHIEKDIGSIDVLVNNAGIQRHRPFTEFLEQEWNGMIIVDQTTVFLVSRMVTRHVIEREAGKVINTCSMQSKLGRDTTAPYVASKGVIRMLTRGICVELARHSIQVNGIAPDYFRTEMTKALVEDKASTT